MDILAEIRRIKGLISQQQAAMAMLHEQVEASMVLLEDAMMRASTIGGGSSMDRAIYIASQDGLRERINSRCQPEPMSGCWLWSNKLQKGYGMFKYNGKRVMAHRVSYVAFSGDIPEGHVVDHLCATKSCVNPDHLEAVTVSENSRRQRHGCTH